MELGNELNEYKDIIESELDKTLPNEGMLQEKVFKAMRYSIFAGGKRLRPILTLKACKLISGDYKKALPFALALEMIHTYSLIHDDLPAMDDDDYRRGKLTNHKVYGEDIAILAGDALLNYAYETMIDAIKNNKNYRNEYINAFIEIAKAAGVFGMIGGQVVDVLSEGKDIGEETLKFIHKNKTSALIEASIVAGAIIGGATEQEINKLRQYGKAIGLGYQIRDDILDEIGDINKLGKDIGSDEENNKVTYVAMYGLEKSIEETKRLSEIAKNALKLFEHKETVDFFKRLCNYLVEREV
ncbi:polyprenyl synthetase family protein [Caldisalinibacter kiritimatiensis]|uniref:Farnesyl diphosphate synthase n=1 Tax=Caldisalinibacter kiritimatiensis TaxID=1304284 RepID=R1CHF5_9FIRM|nr:farnesyl diphosphate synthase [Caldisalinibacter kiritimatiensis]EOD01725.1 Polyprenyl synthetase [Caldisalinibacter kiritimatiensis]